MNQEKHQGAKGSHLQGEPAEDKGIKAILNDPETADRIHKKKPGKDKESKAINAILDDPETNDWMSKKRTGKEEAGKAINAILDDPEVNDWISKNQGNKTKRELLVDYPKTTQSVGPLGQEKKGYARILGYTGGGTDQQRGEANSLQQTLDIGTGLVAEPSLHRQRISQQESLPGAFRLNGPGASGGQEVPDPEAASQEEYTPDSLGPHNDQGWGGNSDLAVARMVDEVPTDMPCAEPSEAQQRTQQQQKPRAFILGCGAFVVIAIALVSVLALTFEGKEEDDSELALILSLPPSHSPSLAPSSQDSYLLSLLPDSTVDAIEDAQSSQAKAFQWALLDLEKNPLLSPPRIVQRFALACFYFSTGGAKWNNNELWLNHTGHECDWYNGKEFAEKTFVDNELGLDRYLAEFFPPSEPQPTRCNNSTGLFQHLWLDQNNLIGYLPPELGLLTSLQTFSLGLKNKLQGTLPTQIGQLTALEGVVFDYILSPGTIPTQVGLLTKMRGLSLGGDTSDTASSGSIPTELGLLTNIQTLQLFNRNLHGPMPDMRLFPKLRWTLLHGNHLTGTIPTQLGYFKTLYWITAGGNNISGTIPTQLGMLTNMGMMSLFFNQLRGTLPTELGLMTAATLLSLRGNMVTGTIPSQLGRMKNLSVALSLHDNPGLTGTIPTQLGLLSHLYRLVFTNNDHTGPIPSEFGMLNSLREIWFGNNSLTGTIPQTLESLHEKLYAFDVANNSLLSGIMPAPLCNINGTCISNTLRGPCIEGIFVGSDCTDMFCGCDCECAGSITNRSIG